MQSVTSRTLPFERSLQAAIARLRRLPGGFPDVVACMVSGLPPLTLTSSGGAEERAALLQQLREAAEERAKLNAQVEHLTSALREERAAAAADCRGADWV